MAHAAAPALDADDGVALVEHAQLDSVHDTPLKTLVDVLLPRHVLEALRLGLGEEEGVDAAVQMGVAGGTPVAGDHDDGADRAVFAY